MVANAKPRRAARAADRVQRTPARRAAARAPRGNGNGRAISVTVASLPGPRKDVMLPQNNATVGAALRAAQLPVTGDMRLNARPVEEDQPVRQGDIVTTVAQVNGG